MSGQAKTYPFRHRRGVGPALRPAPGWYLFMHSQRAMTMHKERFRRPRQSEVGARLRPVFDDFHLLRMEGSYEYPRHQHTNYEVILIERGPYQIGRASCRERV